MEDFETENAVKNQLDFVLATNDPFTHNVRYR